MHTGKFFKRLIRWLGLGLDIAFVVLKIDGMRKVFETVSISLTKYTSGLEISNIARPI